MPTTIGIPDQIALLNNRPLQGDEIEDTRDAGEKYAEFATRSLKQLGISAFTENVDDFNPKLTAALAQIAATGAPAPVVRKVTIALPSGIGAWVTDVYRYTHFQDPKNYHDAAEYLLAIDPLTVIASLNAAGIRAKQD